MKARRIAIWGNSGSGKSTLAQQLATEVGLPAYHVDKIAWQSGWRYTDEAPFLILHQNWIDQPDWIIEGVGHTSGLRKRFERAELIVFLDTPVEICRARARRRIEADRQTQNRFIADGCRYGDVVEKQWRIIDYFDQHLRAEIAAMIEEEFSCTKHLLLDGRKTATELSAEIKASESRRRD